MNFRAKEINLFCQSAVYFKITFCQEQSPFELQPFAQFEVHPSHTVTDVVPSKAVKTPEAVPVEELPLAEDTCSSAAVSELAPVRMDVLSLINRQRFGLRVSNPVSDTTPASAAEPKSLGAVAITLFNR